MDEIEEAVIELAETPPALDPSRNLEKFTERIGVDYCK